MSDETIDGTHILADKRAEVERLHNKYLDAHNRYSQARHDMENRREDAHNAYLEYQAALRDARDLSRPVVF